MIKKILGKATKEGTFAYAQRNKQYAFETWHKDGYAVSKVGFGGYRISVNELQHEQALIKALLSGVNLIDTSTNYQDGDSERLIGKVLQNLQKAEKIKREEIVIVSKVGYLQGENYIQSQENKNKGKSWQDLVLFEEGLEHCIGPDFIESQLNDSLERLGLEKIDCYLLHNPEYYLKWAKRKKINYKKAKAEYLKRIYKAFCHLEKEVQNGRIASYGVSSNAFVLPKEEFEYTSLEDIWELAESISPKNHFRIVQFPLNLFEMSALTEKKIPNNKSVLEFALEKKLNVLTNRPLNAIKNDRLIRLSEKVYRGQARLEAESFLKKIALLHKNWENVNDLSTLALRVLRTLPAVSAVLVGMRRDNYVDAVLEDLKIACEKLSFAESEKIASLF